MALTKQNLIDYTDLSKCTTDQIRQVIKEYNLIIHTTMGTYDTSDYNLCDNHNSIVSTNFTTVFQGNDNKGSIFLAKNIKGSELIKNNALTNEDKIVLIPFKSINRITVKSKRNFLLNQEEIKLK